MKIVVKNSMIHTLIYGYFQHSYEIWYVKQKTEVISQFSHADLLEQKRLFADIRFRLRGVQSHSAPSVINSAVSLLGGDNMYPMSIDIPSQYAIFFEQIVNIKFSRLQFYYNRYCKLNKVEPVVNPFSELIENLRTEKTIEFLMKKFLRDYKKVLVRTK